MYLDCLKLLDVFETFFLKKNPKKIFSYWGLYLAMLQWIQGVNVIQLGVNAFHSFSYYGV